MTLVNLALFDLAGMQLSPRIRDLGRIALYRTAPQRDVARSWPVAGPLLTQEINLSLIEENWDELLRLAASINPSTPYAAASSTPTKARSATATWPPRPSRHGA
ncbi:Tn3 family transposase [Streptomyces nondiastaticus]|uniref:Tn3 family transposase n=1 Tax=Streptomyces nondiastaticus TaxID=3154512 RepID=A0ABW6U5Q1_9ACTN